MAKSKNKKAEGVDFVKLKPGQEFKQYLDGLKEFEDSDIDTATKSSIEDILQEVRKINNSREAAYQKDYYDHLAKKVLKLERLNDAKKWYNYLNAPQMGRSWGIEYAWLNKDAYNEGWRMAEAGKNGKVEFEENTFANKRANFIAGYADRLLCDFIEKYEGDPKKSSREKELTATAEHFKQKPIAIAYWALGIDITTQNAKEILRLHAGGKGNIDSFCDEKIVSTRQLTEVPLIKSSSTRHLNALNAALRLLTVSKRFLKVGNKKKAIDKLTEIIDSVTAEHEKIHK